MMFSTNPFPHIFPPSNSDSFHDQEKDDLYINPFLSGDCFPAKENSNSTQELGFEQQFEEYNHLFWSEVKNKRSSKKDHHSKIQTAKGPRDRRVRLSIEVAKKFFYLQDLLEVDKASKTLDWLFQKSKVSIDELIMRKKQSSGSTVTDQSEVVFMETGSEGRKEKSDEGKRKRIISREYKSGFSVSQSRAEARARARERTKEKLNIKKLDYKDCCSSNLTLQSSFWNSVESQNDYDLSSKFTALPKFTDVVELQPGDCATI